MGEGEGEMTSLLDRLNALPFAPTALTVGAAYFGYFAAAAASLVCLATAPDAQWPVDFAAITVFVTSGLHFGLTAFGFAVIPEYDAYPVGYTWAYLFSDLFQSGALGAAIATRALDPSHRPALVAACIVTMCAQILCFYKTYTLVTDVWAGRRDRITGKLLDQPR